MPNASWAPLPVTDDVKRIAQVINDQLTLQLGYLARLQRVNTRTLTANTKLNASDDVVVLDTSVGSVTVTAPPALGARPFLLQKSAAANTATFAAHAGETVNGAASYPWTTQWESHEFFPTGPTSWGVR